MTRRDLTVSNGCPNNRNMLSRKDIGSGIIEVEETKQAGRTL